MLEILLGGVKAGAPPKIMYATGGSQGSYDKITFDSWTTLNSVALANWATECHGSCNLTYGVGIGGRPNGAAITGAISRWVFATEAFTASIATATARSMGGAAGTLAMAYVFGGIDGSSVRTASIGTYAYANGTQTTAGNMQNVRDRPVTTGNSTYAATFSGGTPTYVAASERFTYANATTAASVSISDTTFTYVTGFSTTTAGYFGTGGTYATMYKHTHASLTLASGIALQYIRQAATGGCNNAVGLMTGGLSTGAAKSTERIDTVTNTQVGSMALTNGRYFAQGYVTGAPWLV